MRNPNGYGSITKLSGNRRKPWMVRAAAEMIYNKDTKKTTCKRNTIGCYATRKEALQALAEYNSDPYNLESANQAFSFTILIYVIIFFRIYNSIIYLIIYKYHIYSLLIIIIQLKTIFLLYIRIFFFIYLTFEHF